MSAAGRGERRGGEHDFYETPAWCVERLFEAWKPCDPTGLWVEPGAGRGSIIRAVDQIYLAKSGRRRWWHAIEIRSEERTGLTELLALDQQEIHRGGRESTVTIADFLSPLFFREYIDASVVMGNPPYSLAEEFVRRARELCPLADIALLLRQGFLSSAERVPLYRKLGTPDFNMLPDRPDFLCDGGTDNADYAWFVFPPDIRASGVLRVLNTTPVAVRRPGGRAAPKEAPAGQGVLALGGTT